MGKGDLDSLMTVFQNIAWLKFMPMVLNDEFAWISTDIWKSLVGEASGGFSGLACVVESRLPTTIALADSPILHASPPVLLHALNFGTLFLHAVWLDDKLQRK